MGHRTRMLMVAALVLLAAGVAAANNPLLNGPPPGLTANPRTTATAPPDTSTGTPGATAASTNGTATTPPALVPTAGATTAPSAPAIDRIVSITRPVEAGAAVSAFTVPTGQQLVVTDVVVTNPGTTPACGASVIPDGNGVPGNGTTGNGTTGQRHADRRSRAGGNRRVGYGAAVRAGPDVAEPRADDGAGVRRRPARVARQRAGGGDHAKRSAALPPAGFLVTPAGG